MKKRRKFRMKKLLPIVLIMLLGGAFGALTILLAESSPYDAGATTLFIFAGMYAGYISQIFLHELGHLIGGLMSGYRFCSFRIGSVMFINEDGRLKTRRYSLAGTGGQCLMAPPELKDGACPVMLYNLSGSIMNLIAGSIILLIAILLRRTPAFYIMLPMTAIAYVFALTNGVPLHTNLVDNDGYNALSLSRDRDALRGFWIQLKISELSHRGLRLKDMPEEYFALPADDKLNNSMTASLAVFACARLMNEHRFEEADRLMAKYLLRKTAIVNLHRAMMVSDRIFCALTGDGGENRVKTLLTKQQQKMMKALKSDPSILRTEYALAVLHERDEKRAAGVRAAFEKLAKSYPFHCDIESERELMAIVDERSREAA